MTRSLMHVVWGMTFAAVLPVVGWAASPSSAKKADPNAVDLFKAIEAGEIEVTLIPRDAIEGTISVTNKTDKPLTIKMPAAFAGVPVLAQIGGGGLGGGLGGGGGNNNGGSNSNANQGLGGGMMGGMGGGMMGGGMMGGMFSVAADKAVKGKVAFVCLDHGLKDPNPRIPYKIVPIESYAKTDEVAEIVKMMCSRELDQHSAQAAAWHVQNGMSWDELAKKIGKKHIGGATEPYFSAAQLQRAFVASQVAQQRAEQAAMERERTPSRSPGESPGETLAQQ
jgi:hypothetical protein